MGVIVDVIFAVAEITVTFGAVTELQLGVGNISAATNGAAMGIAGVSLLCGYFAYFYFGKRNGFGLLSRNPFFENPEKFDAPTQRENIQHLLAEEKELVGK